MRINTLDGWYESKHRRMRVAAAVIGGVATLAGAGIGAASSMSAASDQENEANQAAQLQQQQFQQTQQNEQPFMQGGQSALKQIGLDQTNGTGFATPFNPQSYIDTPGYQFQMQQGQQAINSSAAATGGVLNGGTLKALDQYTTGLANTTYGTAYNQYLQNSNQQYNQLFSQAQLGQNAASTTGYQGTQAANNAGNYLTQAGSAQAAGALGAGSAANSGVGGLGLLAYAGLNSQSGYAPIGNTGPGYADGAYGGNWMTGLNPTPPTLGNIDLTGGN